jgi:hypothetical protein
MSIQWDRWAFCIQRRPSSATGPQPPIFHVPTFNGKATFYCSQHVPKKHFIPHLNKQHPSLSKTSLVPRTMPTMEESYHHPGAPLHPPGSMNRCAGCSVVDVPLLACDDIDVDGTVADPSQRARWVLFSNGRASRRFLTTFSLVLK